MLRLWIRGEGLRGIERLTAVDRKTLRRYVAALAEVVAGVGQHAIDSLEVWLLDGDGGIELRSVPSREPGPGDVPVHAMGGGTFVSEARATARIQPATTRCVGWPTVGTSPCPVRDDPCDSQSTTAIIRSSFVQSLQLDYGGMSTCPNIFPCSPRGPFGSAEPTSSGIPLRDRQAERMYASVRLYTPRSSDATLCSRS